MNNLISSIQYQENSIVSKEVVKSANGTITLFAFGKGEGLSSHQTSYTAFALILEGKAMIKISSEVSNLEAGQSIILPANVIHQVEAITDFKMLLIMIK